MRRMLKYCGSVIKVDENIFKINQNHSQNFGTAITHIHIITHNKDTCIQNDILDIYIVFLFDGFVTGTRYIDNYQ